MSALDRAFVGTVNEKEFMLPGFGRESGGCGTPSGPRCDGRYELKGEGGQTTLDLSLRFAPATPMLNVTCNAKTAMLNQVGLVPSEREKIPARHRGRSSRSYRAPVLES